VSYTLGFHVRHQYYRLHPEVLDVWRAVLIGRYTADQVPNRTKLSGKRQYRIDAK